MTEEAEQEKLIGLLASFSNKLLRSGFCVFDLQHIKSIAVWQVMQSKHRYDRLVSLIQYTNSNVRYFTLGIKQDPKPAAEKMGRQFAEDAEMLRKEMLQYISRHATTISVELWVSELNRSMAHVLQLFRPPMKVEDL